MAAALRVSVSCLLVFGLAAAAVAGWWYTKNLLDSGVDWCDRNGPVAA
jgi:hypothetical protein